MSRWHFPETEFLGNRLTLLNQEAILEAVAEAVAQRHSLYQASLNAAKVVAGRRDPKARDLLAPFDLICADGMAVVWGARLLGLPALQRIAGIDLMQALLARAAQHGWRVFFLGATPEILAAMQRRLQQQLPRMVIAGTEHGYHPPDEDAAMATAIRHSKPDLLFVGMPTPRKEQFLMEQRERLGVSFAMGVGGSFDVLAGKVRRAPRRLQQAGLEWAFRLAQEPARLWRRYLVSNSRFLLLLMRARLLGLPPGKVSN